jgi:hypothetical protein
LIKLDTKRKRETLSTIVLMFERDNGNHDYHVIVDDLGKDSSRIILGFEKDGKNIECSINGLTGVNSLEICRDRLLCYQSSEYSYMENATVLSRINEALTHINNRMVMTNE